MKGNLLIGLHEPMARLANWDEGRAFAVDASADALVGTVRHVSPLAAASLGQGLITLHPFFRHRPFLPWHHAY